MRGAGNRPFSFSFYSNWIVQMTRVVALKPTYNPTTGHHDVGAKFDINDEARLEAYVQTGLVAVFGSESEMSQEEYVEKTMPELGESTLDQLKAAWEFDMTPKEYMEKFPEGPLADLALRILELEAETAQ